MRLEIFTNRAPGIYFNGKARFAGKAALIKELKGKLKMARYEFTGSEFSLVRALALIQDGGQERNPWKRLEQLERGFN